MYALHESIASTRLIGARFVCLSAAVDASHRRSCVADGALPKLLTEYERRKLLRVALNVDFYLVALREDLAALAVRTVGLDIGF